MDKLLDHGPRSVVDLNDPLSVVEVYLGFVVVASVCNNFLDPAAQEHVTDSVQACSILRYWYRLNRAARASKRLSGLGAANPAPLRSRLGKKNGHPSRHRAVCTDGGSYGRPKQSATARCVTRPRSMLMPLARPGSAFAAAE